MPSSREPSAIEGTILLIEDDATYSFLLGEQLESQNFRVLHAFDGQQGVQMAREHHPDLILLDVLLPLLDGWETLRQIRKFANMPVIMLTCRTSELDKVRGLELGADDYVAKPVGKMELVARVRAVLRRVRASIPAGPIIRVDDRLTVDRTRGQIYVEGRLVDVSATEFRLLNCFLDYPNQVLSHRSLLTQVWGWEYDNETDYLKVYVHHLRSKIEPDLRNPRYILTERGLGYRFCLPADL